ncbi:MAG TPA: SDR family NAD(P)-dependent oxidoreductase [Pirellulales bacterium]|nr:SDR family NAD(P)-dependent oxidoreductase [Pirellulales bacterium]
MTGNPATNNGIWHGRVAIVTGGSSGLGRAMARALVAGGARVVIGARGADKLQAVADELGHLDGEIMAVPCDITRQADVDLLFAQTIERFGRLDMLVNNAGRSARGAIIDTPPEEFTAMMDLNLIALVRCSRAAMAPLLAARGHLVNIGSLAGKTAAPYMGAYAATKHAVSAYSQQLRLELAEQGLHVLLVSPGPIARDEPRSYAADKVAAVPPAARRPGGGAKVRLINANHLADQILVACRRRQPELVVPGRARLVFALSQLSPRLGDWVIRKMTS